MKTKLILGLCISTPAVAIWVWANFFRSFMSWSGSRFDPYGTSWITVQTIYFGLVGFGFGLALLRAMEARHIQAATSLAVMTTALFMQVAPNGFLDSDSYANRAIELLGYGISRLRPFKPHDRTIPANTRAVLAPYMRVDVVTPKGRIGIAAGAGTLRKLYWDGVERSLELTAQNNGGGEYTLQSRLHDRSGVRIPEHDWEMHRGITRGELWENEENYDTISQCESSLREEQDDALPLVWTNDGLVIGWSTQCDARALTVIVRQVLIHGKKPTRLKGANDAAFDFSKQAR